MALIGKIRKQKWLLVGSMAAALFLFIAMLMFDNPNQSLFGGSQTTIGKIEGKKIEYQEFSNIHDMLYRNANTDGFSERSFLWNYFVDEAIVSKEAEAIGLGVSKNELLDLQFSTDVTQLSPIITSRYQNPQTFQVDMNQLSQIKNIITTNQIDQLIQSGQLVPDFKFRWAHQEKEIIKDRLQTKISNMVAKGMFTPSWMAEMIGAEQNEVIDFHYVVVPFDKIEDTAVSLSDDDYKTYFDENKYMFRQDEETRIVEYLEFPVIATSKDSSEIERNITDLVDDFKATENDSSFVESNFGTIDEAYFKKDEVSAAVADVLFTMPVGDVYGPYLDEGAYKAVKLLGRKVIPDSVKARHILLKADDQTMFNAANATSDSLKIVLETGADSWDSVAAKYSVDLSNAMKGGDLGYFAAGTMVKPFNDLCFFSAEPGKVYKVFTQFGIHLVEVTGRKFGNKGEGVKVAYISQNIIPSQSTQDAVREQALQLQEENKSLELLRKSAVAKKLEVKTSPALKINDFAIGALGPGQASREIVRWAFGFDQNTKTAKVGDVSPQVFGFQDQQQFYVNKYVVAGLQSVVEAGEPNWKDIRSTLEPMVRNKKKGDLIVEKINNLPSLSDAASLYSLEIDTANSVSFAGAFIPGAGSEPKVVAKAFKTELNKLSEPVIGTLGVFILSPINKPTPSSAVNIAMIQQSSQQTSRSFVRSRLSEGLRKNADIKDNRARFF
jgi:peptidyl-prolyl cis-trans isomerase D